MSTQPKTFITPEQYLEIERKAEYKSEYYQGEMFAMAGAQTPHNTLAANAIIELGPQVRSRRCRILTSDQRICVSESGLYTYADLVVVCGQPEFTDAHIDTIRNPTVIVEVLSPSTEAYDRGRKFQLYKFAKSLQEYVLVASEQVHVDVFTRQADGSWLLRSATTLEESVELQSIGCRVPLAGLYTDVELGEQRIGRG